MVHDAATVRLLCSSPLATAALFAALLELGTGVNTGTMNTTAWENLGRWWKRHTGGGSTR